MRAYISARFLLADAPGSTVIPDGFQVAICPPRTAAGAHKPRTASRGDAPTTSHAANRDGAICGNPQHATIRNLAARGW